MSDRIVKTHVYYVPGLAAGTSIFEYIELPSSQFENHFLEWFVPSDKTTLAEYAYEMNKKIHHDNSVLIGVSFGGILVQEMAKQMSFKKVIIISSVKTSDELPTKMKLASYTNIHRLLPMSLVANVEVLGKFAFGKSVTKRLKLYEKYLDMRDVKYLKWAINQMVNWKQSEPLDNLIHIHGEKDPVFPIRKIKDCISVKNGTHTMIIHRSSWFNEHLPTIILK